jgi:hypothetical protein
VHPRAAMYPVASDHTSLQMWAPTLPRVLWPRTSSPCQCGIRRYHVSRGPGPHLLAEVSFAVAMCPSAPGLASLSRWALALPHVLWLWALPPRGESSGAATAPSGLWITGIKKCLAILGTQLGLRVFKVRSCVTEASARRAYMSLQCGSTVQRWLS